MPDTSTLAAPVEVVIDCESDRLRYGALGWEVAAIVRRRGLADVSYVWHLLDDNGGIFRTVQADPASLDFGGFYERHPLAVIADPMDPLSPTPDDHPSRNLIDLDGKPLGNRHLLCTEQVLVWQLERLIRNAVVWGCNPEYDLGILKPLFARHGIAWKAHYRPMCATTWAAGVASGRGWDVGSVPYENRHVGAAFGVERNKDGKAHQGLADCGYAIRLLDAARTVALEARAARS